MSLWEIIFPRRCFGCGRIGSFVCGGCAAVLKEVNTQTCLYCKKPNMWGLTHPACRRLRGVDGAISLYYYNNTLKRILAGIKYHLVTDALPDLYYIIGKKSSFLTKIYGEKSNIPLQAIPQARQRLNERGFSQTDAIMGAFSRLLSLPQIDTLIKYKETTPQAIQKTHADRRKNIKNSFVVKAGEKIPPEVILVDDVVTSGETVKEAAGALKKMGAKKVYVLSVAKG